VGKNILF